MTQTIGTDSNNDLYLGSNGNIVILQSQSAVVAACRSASLLSLGEAVLATTTGIPFFQAVFNGQPNIAVFQSYLRTAILNVPGVLSIQNLTTNVNGGVLSYSVTIQSIYGETVIAGSVPI